MASSGKRPMIDLSELDTKRFGVPSARAEDITFDTLPAVDDFCKRYGIKFLVARCKADRLDVAQALEERGFRLMDTLVWLQFNFAKTPVIRQEDYVVREIRSGDETVVREISRAAFSNYVGGHYHSDAKIDRTVCADIYADWAYNSCTSKKVADHVLVAECDEQIAGFITLKKNGEIPLNAVSPAMQKRGIYRSLVTGALPLLKSNGAKHARISTQVNNIAVQKVCQRVGFEPLEAAYTFHKWF